MNRYNVKKYLNELTKEQHDKALVEIPEKLEISEKHFKYGIYNGTIHKAPNIRINQLEKIRDYLIETYPWKFNRLTIDDLINDPQTQAEAA